MSRPTPVRPAGARPCLVLLLAGVLGAGACESGERPSAPVANLRAVPSPASPGSGEPNLTVDADGVAYLSWLEPSETGHALRFARLEGEAWTEPKTIIDRADLFVNWADFPSLAFFGDRESGSVMAAHWLQMSAAGTYTYDVRMALSRDGGATWGDDITPHRDGVAAEHGFVSLLPAPGAGLAALWLDGRATVDGEPMTLRFTTVDAGGQLGPEDRVDASVCDCCQTAMARTSSGLVAAYRNRTADEVRDIYVARYANGSWDEGRPVHEDGWVINGCPVNGPAVAARGDTVVVAWFTAAESGRVLAAFSTDGGATFGTPVRVDDGGGMGRVDALAQEGGGALVSWLERTAEGAEVRVRRVGPTGPGPAVTVAGAAAERATGFPRMVRVGNRVVFAWTGPGEDGGVQTAVGGLNQPAGNRDE